MLPWTEATIRLGSRSRALTGMGRGGL